MKWPVLIVAIAACSGGSHSAGPPAPIETRKSPAKSTAVPAASPRAIASAIIDAYAKRDIERLWKLSSANRRRIFAAGRGNPKRYFPGCFEKEFSVSPDVVDKLSPFERFKLIKSVALPPAGHFELHSGVRITTKGPDTRLVDFSINVPPSVSKGECELRLVKHDGQWRADSGVLCSWETPEAGTPGPVGLLYRQLARVRSIRLWQVDSIRTSSPAHGILQPGDVVLEANGASVALHRSPSLLRVLREAGDRPIVLTIMRNMSSRMKVRITPKNGRLGVSMNPAYHCP